jgi:hypothetical protein
MPPSVAPRQLPNTSAHAIKERPKTAHPPAFSDGCCTNNTQASSKNARKSLFRMGYFGTANFTLDTADSGAQTAHPSDSSKSTGESYPFRRASNRARAIPAQRRSRHPGRRHSRAMMSCRGRRARAMVPLHNIMFLIPALARGSRSTAPLLSRVRSRDSRKHESAGFKGRKRLTRGQSAEPPDRRDRIAEARHRPPRTRQDKAQAQSGACGSPPRGAYRTVLEMWPSG